MAIDVKPGQTIRITISKTIAREAARKTIERLFNKDKALVAPLHARSKNFKAIHCVFPAGCAVVAATHVEQIVEAQWRDLGMPETLWHCDVKELGPLIVSIDPDGRNLFEENKVTFNERKDKALEEIYPQVSFIK